MKRFLTIILCLSLSSLALAAPSDMDKVLALVPTSAATAKAVKSGEWSDPATWDKVPAAGGNVWIPAGLSVALDVDTPRLRSVRVDGSLYPCNCKQPSTTLYVNLLVTTDGSRFYADMTGAVTPTPPTPPTPPAPTPPPPPAKPALTLGQLIALQSSVDQVTLQRIFDGYDPKSSLIPLPPPPIPPPAPAPDPTPVPSGQTGRFKVVFITDYQFSLAEDPWYFAPGAVLMGEVDLNGQPTTGRAMTVGNYKKGDTAITLASIPTNWNVGDKLVIPGVAAQYYHPWGPQHNYDDDVCTISAINGTSITLAAPLAFNHAGIDARGKTRPLFCANVSPRSISFESESPGPLGGHVMFMGDINTKRSRKYCSCINLGRTRADIDVTDPDGLGGGTNNTRGRYAGFHDHVIGVDRTKPFNITQDCLTVNPSNTLIRWGDVIHGSQTNITRQVSFNIFGAHIASENGTEIGLIDDATLVRTTQPGMNDAITDNTGHGANGWGFQGTNIFLVGGGVDVNGGIFTGGSCAGIFALGVDFVPVGSPSFTPLTFPIKNLHPRYPQPSVNPGDRDYISAANKPIYITNARWFGQLVGIKVWGGGPNRPEWRSTIADCNGESDYGGIVLNYCMQMDLVRDEVTCSYQPYRGDTAGFSGNAFVTNINKTDCKAWGYRFGAMIPTDGGGSVKRLEHDCLSGLYCYFSYQGRGPIALEEITMRPIPPEILAAWIKIDTGKEFLGFQNNQQVNLLAPLHFSGPWRLRDMLDGPFGNLAQFYWFTARFLGARGITTYDGQTLYWEEENLDFQLDRIAKLPPIFKGLTTRQLWEQYKLAPFGRRIPADAVRVPNSMAWVSSAPAQYLPAFLVRPDERLEGQAFYTNKKTQFSGKVKDLTSGQLVSTVPQDLIDKAWNVVFVTIQGEQAGVMVYCDTSLTDDQINQRWKQF